MNSLRNVLSPSPREDEEIAAAHARQTPEAILGPFYPADRVAPRRSDLRVMDGSEAVASGEPILVSVRLVNAQGARLEGIYVEFWQANSTGPFPWSPG